MLGLADIRNWLKTLENKAFLVGIIVRGQRGLCHPLPAQETQHLQGGFQILRAVVHPRQAVGVDIDPEGPVRLSCTRSHSSCIYSFYTWRRACWFR